MKLVISSRIFLYAIIMLLGICATYQTVQRQRARKSMSKYHLALAVGLYDSLEKDGVEATKGRLGALVSSTLQYYDERYGREVPQPEFAQKIIQAKAIQQEHQKRLLSVKSGPGADYHLTQTQAAYTPGVALESLTRYVLELPNHHSQTFTNFASKAMLDAVGSLPRGSVLYYDGSGLITPPKEAQVAVLEAFCKNKGVQFVRSPTN